MPFQRMSRKTLPKLIWFPRTALPSDLIKLYRERSGSTSLSASYSFLKVFLSSCIFPLVFFMYSDPNTQCFSIKSLFSLQVLLKPFSHMVDWRRFLHDDAATCTVSILELGRHTNLLIRYYHHTWVSIQYCDLLWLLITFLTLDQGCPNYGPRAIFNWPAANSKNIMKYGPHMKL